MAISSFFGLNTALKGLVAHQRALDVTAHNIGNASTEGYSRQRADLETAPALFVPQVTGDGGSSMLGAGVDVAGFIRVRDLFADLQFRAQNMSLGEHEATAALLQQAELSLS